MESFLSYPLTCESSLGLLFDVGKPLGASEQVRKAFNIQKMLLDWDQDSHQWWLYDIHGFPHPRSLTKYPPNYFHLSSYTFANYLVNFLYVFFLILIGSGSLRAKFDLSEGPSKPATLAVQFISEGSTLSGVDVELVGTGYRLSLIKKRFATGKRIHIMLSWYIIEPICSSSVIKYQMYFICEMYIACILLV